MKHYQAGRFAEAAAGFERAYTAEAKPLYLFTWAQAEIGRDDCRAAVALFRRYLDTNPPEQNKKAAEKRMATCAEKLVAVPPDAGAPDADVSSEPDAAPEASTPQSVAPDAAAPLLVPLPAPVQSRSAAHDPGTTSPWYTDPLGMILLGTGAIAAGVGTGFLVASYSKEGDADDGAFSRYDEHRSALDTAQRQRTIGAISGGVGVALMAAGVFRLITREPDSKTNVGVWLAPQAGGASVSRGF